MRKTLTVLTAVCTALTMWLAFSAGTNVHADEAQDTNCYEQINEARYERATTITESEYSQQLTRDEARYEREVPVTITEHRYEKETRERTGNTSEWSAWTDWPDQGPRPWGVVPDPLSGHHGGHHDHPTKFDRDYRYVIVDTREVQTGTTTEDSGWITGTPDGDGWQLVEERTVDAGTDTLWSATDPGSPWTATGNTRDIAGEPETTGWVTEAPAGDGWTLLEERTTDGERIACPQPENPEPVTEDRLFVEARCDSETVLYTQDTTTETYVLDGLDWVLTSSTVTVEIVEAFDTFDGDELDVLVEFCRADTSTTTMPPTTPPTTQPPTTEPPVTTTPDTTVPPTTLAPPTRGEPTPTAVPAPLFNVCDGTISMAEVTNVVWTVDGIEYIDTDDDRIIEYVVPIGTTATVVATGVLQPLGGVTSWEFTASDCSPAPTPTPAPAPAPAPAPSPDLPQTGAGTWIIGGIALWSVLCGLMLFAVARFKRNSASLR